MNKETLNRILNRIDELLLRDDKQQKAMEVFTEAFACDSYAPILEDNPITYYIEGITEFEPDLKDDLEYYAWEIPTMQDPNGSIQTDGKIKKYNFNNRAEFIDFVLTRVKDL